ncbi:MAG: hypothetical protein KatS3mg031_2629 [Chitinophagales bacterium]|nr:MAG: hypothetical protein KatS3mg031_2629 [Chitinophagales bacterium]
MNKNSIGYRVKKWAGITVLRSFEQVIRLVDGDREFFPAEDFPFTRELEAYWQEIRKEYAQIHAKEDIPPIEEIFPEQARITHDRGWRSYMLAIYGYDFAHHQQACPVTTAILNKIPLMTSAFFSVLQPHSAIAPHRGIYKGVLRCHLGLLVPHPEQCALVINGKEVHWQEGRCMVFDDTFPHTAWNRSDKARVVLFIDFIRPLPEPFHTINLFLFRLLARTEFITEVLSRSRQRDGSSFRERYPLKRAPYRC